jgi:PAS domain-containing protein
MKKYKLLIIFLLFFLINQASMIFAKTPIKVGVYENEPLIFTDSSGEVNGIFADIIEYVASKEGWKIEYVKGVCTQCLDRLEKSKIDILSIIAYSRERDKLYDFSRENILTNWGQIYTQRDSDIKAIVDLNNKRVGVLKESTISKDGNAVPVEGNINCRFEDNKPVSTRGSFRDISERIEKEEALRKIEERCRSLVESTTDGYFVCEIPSGTNLFLNQRICDIFGYTMEEGLRITIWETLAPEENSIARERIQKMLKGKDPGPIAGYTMPYVKTAPCPANDPDASLHGYI